jgi:hypothetical protein
MSSLSGAPWHRDLQDLCAPLGGPVFRILDEWARPQQETRIKAGTWTPTRPIGRTSRFPEFNFLAQLLRRMAFEKSPRSKE